MSLNSIEESLLLAAYFRGRIPEDDRWRSNTDQILTLSLFYTGDISAAGCNDRFANRSYVGKLYADDVDWSEEDGYGKLTEEIESRYNVLIQLLREHPELIEGGGDFETPAHPTYTACRLTDAGLELATQLIDKFPKKPDFPNWPDRRMPPDRK